MHAMIYEYIKEPVMYKGQPIKKFLKPDFDKMMLEKINLIEDVLGFEVDYHIDDVQYKYLNFVQAIPDKERSTKVSSEYFFKSELSNPYFAKEDSLIIEAYKPFVDEYHENTKDIHLNELTSIQKRHVIEKFAWAFDFYIAYKYTHVGFNLIIKYMEKYKKSYVYLDELLSLDNQINILNGEMLFLEDLLAMKACYPNKEFTHHLLQKSWEIVKPNRKIVNISNLSQLTYDDILADIGYTL